MSHTPLSRVDRSVGWRLESPKVELPPLGATRDPRRRTLTHPPLPSPPAQLASIEELTLASNPCSATTMLLFQKQLDLRKARIPPEADLNELAREFHFE